MYSWHISAVAQPSSPKPDHRGPGEGDLAFKMQAQILEAVVYVQQGGAVPWAAIRVAEWPLANVKARMLVVEIKLAPQSV